MSEPTKPDYQNLTAMIRAKREQATGEIGCKLERGNRYQLTKIENNYLPAGENRQIDQEEPDGQRADH
ncbi:hypothetical protein [Geobacter sp. AOG1]|uniref:hypothetical protein n=1 Tax=Geobacter sp. AOG1 TaxID=1566346 RepID=UPI001CC4A279|nr:hypothetical protein [Geobacter sp. AOG1]GFE57739.1 hypothetical protein AOG1_16190 [Geobacter sp. AOG1]